MKPADRPWSSGSLRWRAVVGACAVVPGIAAMPERTMAREPEPVSVQTRCLPSDGRQLDLRLWAFDRRRQLVISLWGSALETERLPRRIDIPVIPLGTMPGSSFVGEARLCAPGQVAECVPVGASLVITSLRLGGPDASIQGRILSVDGAVNQADPVVFDGKVDDRIRCG